MNPAATYYQKLLDSGYDSNSAVEHTRAYFPDFLSEASLEKNENHPKNLDLNSDYRPKYIPVAKSKIKEKILASWQIDVATKESLTNVFSMFEAIWHHDFHSKMQEMKEQYTFMDPDSNEEIRYSYEDALKFIQTFEETMVNGNWESVTEEEIEQALESEDVLPISLDVRFDEYKNQRYYKLGQHVEEREIQTFFGLKKEKKSIRVFEKVITLLEFHNEDWFLSNNKKRFYPGQEGRGLHLRLFKDVPHLDMEVIFSNTSPSMRTLEKIKIIAPLVAGIVSLGMKYGPLLLGGETGSTSLSLVGGLLSGLGAYVLKTYTSYQKTREKFRNIVAKDMYFKGLANNSSVLSVVVDMAEEQEVKEAILAYAVLVMNQPNSFTENSLDQYIESWLMNCFDVDIDFEVDDALAKLDRMHLLSRNDSGLLSVKGTGEALLLLDDYWDNLYDFVGN